MGSAIVELFLLSLPSLLYTRRLRRSGCDRRGALRAVGLQRGSNRAYVLALILVPVASGLALALVGLIPAGILHGHSKNVIGTPTTAAGYAGIVILALAEEMLFRGFLASLLFRRYGFQIGNAIQAAVFLAPHLLLLLVSLQLWPILPLQLIAGWVLGWLRHRADSIAPGWLLHAVINLLPALVLAG